MSNITTEVFWNDHRGWTYRTKTGDHEESGPVCDDLPRDTPPGRVLMAAAAELGIDPSAVALVRDGGPQIMETNATTAEYNGHPSWRHWNCSLWAFNDEPLYREIQTKARYALVIQPDDLTPEEIADKATTELAVYLRDILTGETPDGAVWTDETREYVAREFIIGTME